ncbi:hypothetical protein JVU11DRAFT_4149 [Chiua virens]|nr:hypothetical protein JVU11DRAFT_4149 [Chiua virens]
MSLLLRSVAGLAVLAFLVNKCRSKQVQPEKEEFDFIIVGGGTAGCVLAARLSERADVRVLLIEAGQSGKALSDSTTPAAFPRLFRSPHDYNLYTVPQQHAHNKKKFWPRARLLGGCSSINALMHVVYSSLFFILTSPRAHYGAPSDYDECAAIVGDDSWSWKSFETYFRKFENYTSDQRFPLVDASLRGSRGPVTVGYNSYIWRAGSLFVKASINAGVPFSPDFNTSNGTLGTNKVLTYIDSRGQRVSSEAAYLTPEVLARPNLKVVTHARVTRIVFDSSSGTPRAVAVEFANGKQQTSRLAKALKEVIVCGGAVHSPHILMLSGVGPADVLTKHNIPVVADSPGVGANLSDHPCFHLRLKDKLGVSHSFMEPYDAISAVKLFKALSQYMIFGTGPLTCNAGEAVAFFRTDDQTLFPPSDYNNDIEDTTSAPNAPDIEVIILPVPIENHSFTLEAGLHGYTLATTVLRKVILPQRASGAFSSSLQTPGTIPSLIQSRSFFPRLIPLPQRALSYLATRHDLDALVRGVRGAYKIAHTAPMTDITDVGCKHPLLDHHFDKLSDKELGEIIRDRVETLYHPFGSCAMGKVDDPRAVLDAQLRVRGTLGLRVCDASVYPKLVSGHTTGPVLAAAEKLADIIKAEYPASL